MNNSLRLFKKAASKNSFGEMIKVNQKQANFLNFSFIILGNHAGGKTSLRTIETPDRELRFEDLKWISCSLQYGL